MSTWPSQASNPPEIPYPFPPDRERPTRRDPVSVPVVPIPSGTPGEQLFDRRRVIVSGRLDSEQTTRLAAELMALDGTSTDPVEIFVGGDGGPLTDVFAVLDVIGLMRAPVNTTCIGGVRGTAAAILASGTGTRRAAQHAMISLRCDQTETFTGSADEAQRRAREVAAMRGRLVDLLASVTGQSATVIRHELDDGDTHDASSALAMGVIDAITDSRRR